MRAVVQRVSGASVRVEGREIGAIDRGILVYLGVGREDGTGDVEWIAEKAANLRIFMDEAEKMNRSVIDEGGAVLLVSQFTLYADARKGRRPSYSDAAPPEEARRLYEHCADILRSTWGLRVETGEFQAVMSVRYTNEGPVTILLDSQKNF